MKTWAGESPESHMTIVALVKQPRLRTASSRQQSDMEKLATEILSGMTSEPIFTYQILD